MGNKGNNRHVKRLASNRYVNVHRKVHAYLAKPNAGRHTADSSIALRTIITEKLSIADNSREARMIIKNGSVEVNGKVVRDERYPIGFGDLIRFVPINKLYRVTVARHGVVSIEEADGKQTKEQVFKVVGKYIARKNKPMIRLHDGTSVSCDKDVSVNDSITLSSGKVGEVLKLEKGAHCLVINGVHASESGVIKEIKKGTATRKPTVEIEIAKGSSETLLDNIMVVSGK